MFKEKDKKEKCISLLRDHGIDLLNSQIDELLSEKYVEVLKRDDDIIIIPTENLLDAIYHQETK